MLIWLALLASIVVLILVFWNLFLCAVAACRSVFEPIAGTRNADEGTGPQGGNGQQYDLSHHGKTSGPGAVAGDPLVQGVGFLVLDRTTARTMTITAAARQTRYNLPVAANEAALACVLPSIL